MQFKGGNAKIDSDDATIDSCTMGAINPESLLDVGDICTADAGNNDGALKEDFLDKKFKKLYGRFLGVISTPFN